MVALDATYRHQGNTPVNGFDLSDPTQPLRLNSRSSDTFGLAPALEYNFTNKLGVLLGMRVIPLGRNTAFTLSPAVAVNFVH